MISRIIEKEEVNENGLFLSILITAGEGKEELEVIRI